MHFNGLKLLICELLIYASFFYLVIFNQNVLIQPFGEMADLSGDTGLTSLIPAPLLHSAASYI